LFYNVPTRRKALRSASEEYQKIIDVVSKLVTLYYEYANDICKYANITHRYMYTLNHKKT